MSWVVEHCNLGKWRHKFKGTEEEWVTMLSFFLLQHPLEKAQVSLLHGVRMVHTLKTDNLELSFRRDVGDIKVSFCLFSSSRSYKRPTRDRSRSA